MSEKTLFVPYLIDMGQLFVDDSLILYNTQYLSGYAKILSAY